MDRNASIRQNARRVTAARVAMKKARLDEELWEAQYSSISDFASDSNSDLEEKAEVEVLDEDPDGSCDLFDGV